MSVIRFLKASVLAECKYVNIKGGLNKHAGKVKDENMLMRQLDIDYNKMDREREWERTCGTTSAKCN